MEGATSALRVTGDFRAEAASQRYGDLIAPGGPLGSLAQTRACVLDMSRKLDPAAGRLWEAGVGLVHLGAGRRFDPVIDHGPVDRQVIVAAAVDGAGRLIDDPDGRWTGDHLARMLRHVVADDGTAAVPTLVLLPDEAIGEPADLGEKVTVARAATLAAALDQVALPVDAPRAALVAVPTTGGLLTIRALRARSGQTARVLIQGDYRPDGLSAAYGRLLAPDGPIAGFSPVLAGDGGFELELTGRIDAGRSWELPVLLAHALVSRGYALTDDPGQAALVMFATGALSTSGALECHDYGLELKLAGARRMLAGAHAGGRRLMVLVPPDPHRTAALASGRRAGWPVQAVDDITAAMAALDQVAGAALAPQPSAPDVGAASAGAPEPSDRPAALARAVPRRRLRGWLGMAGLAVLISAGAAVALMGTPTGTPMPHQPDRPDPSKVPVPEPPTQAAQPQPDAGRHDGMKPAEPSHPAATNSEPQSVPAGDVRLVALLPPVGWNCLQVFADGRRYVERPLQGLLVRRAGELCGLRMTPAAAGAATVRPGATLKQVLVQADATGQTLVLFPHGVPIGRHQLSLVNRTTGEAHPVEIELRAGD